jgi:hypothetical protein
MEYTIIEGFVAAEVIAAVNAHLKEGWELHGSLAVSSQAGTEEGHVHLYAQAMTKKAAEEWSTA